MVEIKNARKHHVLLGAFSIIFVFSGLTILANHFSAINDLKHFTGVNGISVKSSQAEVAVKDVVIGAQDDALAVKRVSVRLQITNKSSAELVISPGFQMFLLDENQHIYNVTARYLAEGASIGGPIASNQKMELTVDFDILPTASPKQFKFQTDATSEPIEVRL